MRSQGSMPSRSKHWDSTSRVASHRRRRDCVVRKAASTRKHMDIISIISIIGDAKEKTRTVRRGGRSRGQHLTVSDEVGELDADLLEVVAEAVRQQLLQDVLDHVAEVQELESQCALYRNRRSTRGYLHEHTGKHVDTIIPSGASSETSLRASCLKALRLIPFSSSACAITNNNPSH